MLLLLSPSKTQESGYHHALATQPEMLDRTDALAEQLKRLDAAEIGRVMKISEQLAKKTRERYSQFKIAAGMESGSPALLAFRGDVFSEIEADGYSDDDFQFAQQHLRIFSALYGILRPLDLIQLYRLEMGGKFRPEGKKSLYDYWRDDINMLLKRHLAGTKISEIVNLASNEYFKAVTPAELPASIIHVFFKQQRKGTLKTIAIHAKKARGAMANYIIRNRLQSSAELKQFHYRNYRFAGELSTAGELFFVDRSTG